MNGQESIADPDPAAVADKVLGQLSASDARAERLVMREVARDLWTEAKRLHELGTGQGERDTHSSFAGADSTRRSA